MLSPIAVLAVLALNYSCTFDAVFDAGGGGAGGGGVTLDQSACCCQVGWGGFAIKHLSPVISESRLFELLSDEQQQRQTNITHCS